MVRIYLINIGDALDYIATNTLEVRSIDFIESADEELCKTLVNTSNDGYSDVYSAKEFEAEFNNDIDGIINTDKYFIRIF